MPTDKYNNFYNDNFEDQIDYTLCEINKHELKLVILELDIVKAYDLISSLNELSKKEYICLQESKRRVELLKQQHRHLKKYGHINLEINE